MTDVLYVNHKAQKCGVYEFGKEIGLLLETSKKFNIKYVECDSFVELKAYYKAIKPSIILYNYHPSTMPWVVPSTKFKPGTAYYLKAIQIGTIHEVYQELADAANNNMFDFHIAPDPTLLLKNPLVYKTGRLLPQKAREVKVINDIPVIGSFGFATPNKGFEKIITLVQNEFDEAIINLNIPFAKFGDTDGQNARKIASNCKNLVTKKGIILNINHDYLEKDDLISFLSKNTLNVFLYDRVPNRGISSATDWALASGRPLAISNSNLFRHLLDRRPSICVSDNTLTTIIENGVGPIRELYNEYSSEVVLWDYERILNNILDKSKSQNIERSFYNFYIQKLKNKLGISTPNLYGHNVWTKERDDLNYVGLIKKNVADYMPVNINNNSLNRILDNTARKLYQPAVDFFSENFPDLIKKKIPEANVQQAFVFDTAVNLTRHLANPKLLAVGAFEDSAAEGLRLLNYDIDFIDPILNYDIETFISKPNVKKNSYDVIISTSVIEHVKEDEKFVQDICYLLKEGGVAILTCDFNDKYKVGDKIPPVDFRFYTQYDLNNRLMTAIPECKLIDKPDWNCENPDFYLADTYNYTFATLVFYKTK